MSTWSDSTAGHPGDLLSALLDGALPGGEAAEVQRHVDACGHCRDELDGVREVRDLLRGLAAVDPPFGFYERLLRDGLPEAKSRRKVKFGLANLVATAAVWLGVVGIMTVPSHGGSVAPAEFASAHAAIVPGLSAGTPPPTSAPAMASTMGAPSELADGFELVGYRRVGDQGQAVYREGSQWLSVFVVEGQVDASALPSGTHELTVEGYPAYEVPSTSGTVVLVEREDSVVVLVGQSPDPAAVRVAADQVPEPSPHTSWLDHLEAAGRGLLDAFGLRD